MRPNAYGPNPDEDIDPFTGLPRSNASRAFAASQDGSLAQGGAPAPRQVSPMSGSNGSVKPADREPLGGATGEWDLSKFRALAPPEGGVFGPNPTHPIGMAPIQRPTPDGPRSAPKSNAQPAMTQQQQYEAAMRGYGAMKPAQPGQDYKMATAGYNAIKGDAAQPQQQYNDAMAGYRAMKGAEAQPRPDRGFLQSLSDGIGDAMTSVDQYVKDTPNLLQLGINMMAAANAPTKSEQWQQFAGSFDKFGQANRLDEDRKLEKEDRALRLEDREREIKRQQEADARAKVVAEQQDKQFGWTSEDREIALGGRNAGIAEAQRILDTGIIKDASALASFQLAAKGVIPVQDALARLGGVDDKTREYQHQKELARLTAERDDARMKNQVDLHAQKQLEIDALQRARNNMNETHVRQGSLNNLYEARQIIVDLVGVGKDGRLAIDTNQTLSQLFDDPIVESKGQQLKSLAVDRGIGLLKAFGGNDTDKEFNLALDTIGNPNNSLQSQYDAINRQIAVNEEAIDRFGAERLWAAENGNIYALKNGVSFTDWYYGKDGPGSKSRGPTVNLVPTTAAQSGASATQIDPNAIVILQQRPTPENKRYFEKTFGLPEGGADKYLQQPPRRKAPPPSVSSQQFGGY
jgi:hypothetical protein